MHFQSTARAAILYCSFGARVWLWEFHSLDFTLVAVYRLNCYIDKQPVVWDLFFAGLRIAGNSR